jgi:hypothetical protein
VDDEAVLDRLTDPQPDEWVSVDHKAVVSLAQGASDHSLGALMDTCRGRPIGADPNPASRLCGRKSG